MSRKRIPITERLKNMIAQISGCWIWQGSTTGSGYGNTYKYIDDKQLSGPAHRISYETFIGPIPKGLTLDHLCRNKLCINPDHLEPVTIKENLLRAENQITTINMKKNECKNGHEFNEKNTYITPLGHRNCRICRYESSLRYKERRIASWAS